jgi:tripartite-type tricarboxylate transporter receptor subunit TctC
LKNTTEVNRNFGKLSGRKFMLSFRNLYGVLAGALLIANTSAAVSQEWPGRNVQVISMFEPGNANDIVGRIVLEQVSKQLGASFSIENRPGGGGTLAVSFVAKSDPDGYTVLLTSSTLSSQVVLHKSLPYDPIGDFAPVAMFGIQPSVLVAAPQKGYKSVADLVAAAKAKPGTLNFASAGIGAASHMAAERFRLATKIDVQHVPYKGPVAALTDLFAGRIDYYFPPIAPAVPHIKDGKVLALAVSTPKRAALLPDVPSIVEAGYPDATYLFWGGLAMPAKTPRAVINKLHDQVQKALADPGVQERLAKLGVQTQPMSVDDFAKFCRDDITATVKLAKDINLTPTN